MRLSPPLPEVQYLPAIFRRIENGDIRIPAFQRDFVWTESQVLDLLESVYRGFPIGSILFWRVDRQILKVESAGTTFPQLPERYPLSYVLDGVQRLATLYGCFHWKDINEENIFNVLFDLDEERFYQYEIRRLPNHYIYLSKVFNPKEFIEAQRSLSTLPNADSLLDTAVKLHSTFQEYMLPTVTITERSVDEVVSIFGRINSTGTKLDTVDFLRAATWSQDFDLNDGLAAISEAAKQNHFEIPDETIVKIFAICAQRDPTPSSMLGLKESNPADLTKAVNQAKQVLTKAIEFLRDQCLIYSYDFVPYEAQLLVIVKYIILAGDSYEKHLADMTRWFWSVSFNESYRGKPDTYLVRDLNHLQQFLSANGEPLPCKLTVDIADFSQRVFMRGRALSSAVANLFASNGVRSLFTTELIPIKDFMSNFSSTNYSFLITPEDIRLSKTSRIRTHRLLANVVLVSDDEYNQLKTTSMLHILRKLMSRGDKIAREVLRSQMLSTEAFQYLEANQYDKFLYSRAMEMYSRAQEVVECRP
jgi:hypothetical protein